MGIESEKSRLESGMVKESVQVEPATESQTLAVYEQVVRVDSSGGAVTITLPPVTEARGKFYSIKLITAGNNCTVQDQDDSYDFNESGTHTIVLTTATDFSLLYSDGEKWYQIDGQIGG